MLANAPYLTRPIETIIPCSSWLQHCYMRLGLLMYDLIAFNGGLPQR